MREQPEGSGGDSSRRQQHGERRRLLHTHILDRSSEFEFGILINSSHQIIVPVLKFFSYWVLLKSEGLVFSLLEAILMHNILLQSVISAETFVTSPEPVRPEKLAVPQALSGPSPSSSL
ncbi:unnamed protein product [Caretta caretta]